MSRWDLDPHNYNLIEVDESERPRPGGFTTREWEEQEWPPCPGCGDPIDVIPVPTPVKFEHGELYIPGRVACLNGCTPPART